MVAGGGRVVQPFLVIVMAGVGLAQEPVGEESPLPASVRLWEWVPLGAEVTEPMSSVAVHPTRPEVVAAATLAGRVVLSDDGGARWRTVLGGLGVGDGPDEEQIRIEVEARAEELLDEAGLDTPDDIELDPADFEDEEAYLEALEDLQDAVDEAQQALQEAAEQAAAELETELQAMPWFVEHAAAVGGSLDAVRPRVWFSPDGWLAVGRADGLYLRPDADGDWVHPLDEPVTALAWWADAWWAGTTDGIRIAVDPLRWQDPDDGTEGLHVFDLAPGPDALLAGSALGLWRTAGGPWAPVGSVREPVRTLLVDPDVADRMWLATDRTVLASDDGGASAQAPLGAPLPGVLSLVHLGAGRVLAAGADGPWETTDGGTSWASVALGLSDPDTRALARRDTAVLLASDEGLLRLEEAAPAAPSPVPAPIALEAWIPVEALMNAALGRHAFQPRSTRRFVNRLLPTITAEGSWSPDDRLLYDPLRGSTRELDGSWTGLLRLEWRRRTGVEMVWTANPSGLPAVDSGGNAAGALTRSGARYSTSVATAVSELYHRRMALVAEAPTLASGTLRERVDHTLQILELEAQLDALTDGAVSQHRLGG